MHAAGWVWRDCKPSHIILHRGAWRLIDFEGACLKTQTGSLPWGSPGYIPPACCKKFSRRAGIYEDDYALGVIAFQFGTGRFPPADPRRRGTCYRRTRCPALLREQLERLLRSIPNRERARRDARNGTLATRYAFSSYFVLDDQSELSGAVHRLRFRFRRADAGAFATGSRFVSRFAQRPGDARLRPGPSALDRRHPFEHRPLSISSQFYFYVLARHVLRQAGINDRKLCDYVASLLETFSRISGLQAPHLADERGQQYISDMLIALTRATPEQAFLLRAHVGNYSLFLSGIFHENTQRRSRRGAPDLKFYEQVGRDELSTGRVACGRAPLRIAGCL